MIRLQNQILLVEKNAEWWNKNEILIMHILTLQ